MSKARQIIPGSTYLITRRCSERRYFLRPDSFITQALMYCLAFAAKRYGISCHVAVSLSNHWHLVVTDSGTKICRFVCFVHMLVAKSVNVFRGRWEGMWSTQRCSIVRLETPDDIFDKICYCLANPTTAQLVRTGAAWPGLWLGPAHLGEHISVERPKKYFRRKGRVPKKLSPQITRPPGFEEFSDEEFAGRVAERLKELEDEKAAEVKAEGKRFMGPAAIMRQSWSSAPKTPAPRRCLDPHIAAKDTKVRLAALDRLTRFWDDHTVATRAWRRGKRGTIFPNGTYLMRVCFNARCHPPPD